MMIVGKKYLIQEKIGEGCFGVVYKGKYVKRNEDVAIKMVDVRTCMTLLKHETKILKYLQEKGCEYIPTVHWYGVDEHFAYLVMTCYDCSLLEFVNEAKRKIETSREKGHVDIAVTLLGPIMKSCIAVLESVHSYFVIHRDIKPQNFMLKGRELFIIDFGLATYYMDQYGEHISGCSHTTIVGSPKYASYFVHAGYVCSRRDDLISLGYMYIYFYCGNLIWNKQFLDQIEPHVENNVAGEQPSQQSQHLHVDEISIFHHNNQSRKKIKSWDFLGKYCEDLSKPIWNYLNYCYSLKIDQVPKYDYLMKTI